MELQGWWSDEEDKALFQTERKAVLKAMVTAEQKEKPPRSELFTDVYDEILPHLAKQQADMEAHVAKYPEVYSSTH